ncbi:MAG: GlsB/YeaQ/YmgE family stress response membrane protein [Acidimicrobiales bacterium]
MGIIGWIVLGLLAGFIAKAIMPGDDPGGVIVTIIIGIVGALLGGFLAAALFDVSVNDEFFDLATWVAAIAGALILLAIYRVVAGGRVARR